MGWFLTPGGPAGAGWRAEPAASAGTRRHHAVPLAAGPVVLYRMPDGTVEFMVGSNRITGYSGGPGSATRIGLFTTGESNSPRFGNAPASVARIAFKFGNGQQFSAATKPGWAGSRLPPRLVLGREPRDQAAGDAGGDDGVAGGGDADRGQDVLQCHVLDQEPARPGAARRTPSRPRRTW